MPNNKSPGNDDLTKEFFEVFWEDLITSLISIFSSVFNKGKLSNSQKQAVIRLIEKKIRINDLFKIGDQFLY